MLDVPTFNKYDLVRVIPASDGRLLGHLTSRHKVHIDSGRIGAVGTVSCPLVKSGDVKLELLEVCHGMGDTGVAGSARDLAYISPECLELVTDKVFVCKTKDSYAVMAVGRDMKSPVAEFSRTLEDARERAESLCRELLEADTPAAPRDRFTIERNNYNISVIDNSIPEHNVILCLTNDYKAGTLDAETIANSLCAMLNAGCGEVSDAFVSMVGGKKGNP